MVGGGETRDYYYDFNWRSVEERVGTPGSQTVKAQYTWSPTDRWTMIRRKRSTTGTLNEVLYVLKDYLDPAALLEPGGPNATVVERFGFDAFGPVRFMNGSFGSIGSSAYDWNFLFHGEFMDQESGLYNYGYRFYHSSLGRWLSRDPIDEADNLNLYRFVANCPPDYIDVLGLMGRRPEKRDCVWILLASHYSESLPLVDPIRKRLKQCDKLGVISCKSKKLNERIPKRARFPSLPDEGGDINCPRLVAQVWAAYFAARKDACKSGSECCKSVTIRLRYSEDAIKCQTVNNLVLPPTETVVPCR